MKFLRSLGPAVIVAAVVCGPGSILSASKVGATQGYSMLWALLLAILLMIGATGLAARIGIGHGGTPGDEIARRIGRPAAIVFGLIVFLICAGFQTSNNLAVIAASELFTGQGVIVTSVLTLGLVAVVLLAPSIYKPVETAMKALVLLMVIAFVANFIAVKPSLLSAASGLIPGPPSGGTLALVGLMATTFSIAGAFYQSYLVRDRGWGQDDLARGSRDSIVGILVLGGITIVIMLTAATVWSGRDPVPDLKSVADVARQMEPLFGTWAKVLFSIGIFAGALSSFLINAMIGGRFLADGFGHGRIPDTRAVRLGTVAALLVGWLGCLVGHFSEFDPVTLILIAQASTVLGGPALACALLYLGTRSEIRAPRWMLVLGWVGLLVTLALAFRTGSGLLAKL